MSAFTPHLKHIFQSFSFSISTELHIYITKKMKAKYYIILIAVIRNCMLFCFLFLTVSAKFNLCVDCYLQQKIVIKMSMKGAKCRTKALQIAVCVRGTCKDNIYIISNMA